MRLTMLMVLAVAVLGFGVIETTEASAPKASASYSRTDVRGKPGRVVNYFVRGWAGQTYTDRGLSLLRIASPTIYRTKGTRRRRRLARRAQQICVSLDLYKFVPSNPGEGSNPWRLQERHDWCDRVSPGYHLSSRDWNFSAQPFVSYSLNIVVTWRSSGGRLLGRALYDYDDPNSDYKCETAKCATLYAVGGVAAITFDF